MSPLLSALPPPSLISNPMSIEIKMPFLAGWPGAAAWLAETGPSPRAWYVSFPMFGPCRHLQCHSETAAAAAARDLIVDSLIGF